MINFTDFCKYYKDCIFEDGSDAILASVRENITTYVRLEGEELSTRDPMEFSDVEKTKISQFIINIINNAPNSSFWYGFPISYTEDDEGTFIKPIFYIPVKYSNAKIPFIEPAFPRLNNKALEDWGIEIQVAKKFAEDIGLYNENQNNINLSELAEKFKNFFSDFYYNEINNGRRIFFKGAIFSSEQSVYTQGLDKELSYLINQNRTSLNNSVLKCYLENNTNTIENNFSDNDLLEVFDLNENQKKAVLSAFNKKLTVVTGPPGTGKSQVVASIVINAAIKNRKVLFASKNHKAVKVVEDKLNSFAEKPFIIRLGKRDDEKNDLRIALINYLNWLYKTSPDNRINEELSESMNRLIILKSKRYKIIETLNKLRVKRNSVLKYYSNFEDNVRNKLYEDEANNIIKKLKLENRIRKSKLLNKKFKTAARYIKTLNDIHKIKYFEDIIDELEQNVFSLKKESEYYFKTWLKSIPLRLDENKRNSLNQFITVLNSLSEPDLPTDLFISLMNRKNELMSQVSDFLNAWCVVNLSTRNEIPLEEGFFDLIVIDEASQCDIASAIPLLFRAKRAVIIGDPNQLQHITTMPTSKSNTLLEKYNISLKNILFDYVQNSLYRLSESRVKKDDIIFLNEHFRSHSDVITFSKNRSEWYDGKLQISTDYRYLHPQIKGNEFAVEWIDVKGKIKQRYGSGAFIEEEVTKVVEKTIELINNNNFIGNIGIVTPFKHQSDNIRYHLNRKLDDLERTRITVNTTVKFQGDERDIMIYSPVVADEIPDGPKFYHKETPNLLNVAITRARAKLIVIGNQGACLNSDITLIRDFAKYVKDLNNGTIRTIEEKSESPYESLLYSAIKDAGIKNAELQYVFGQYRLDIAIINNNKKIDIEVDGKEIHTDWTGERLKADIVRNHRLQNQGWKVLRFWTYEIRDKINYCIDRIKKEVEAN